MNCCGIFSRSQKGSENKCKISCDLPTQRRIFRQWNVPILWSIQEWILQLCDKMNIPARDLPLAEKIQECQERCGRTYGYRRVHIWLERNDIYRNPKTVLRVMQKYNLLSAVRRKKYRNYGECFHRYKNLLNRNFKAGKPNQKWVTDISYIKTSQETLYLSVIRDLFDNFIRAEYW